VIGGKGQDPERLDTAFAVQLLLAEEAREHVGPVDLGQIVLVDGVSAWPNRGRISPNRAVVPSGRVSSVALASSRRTLSSRDDEAPRVGSSPALIRTTALA